MRRWQDRTSEMWSHIGTTVRPVSCQSETVAPDRSRRLEWPFLQGPNRNALRLPCAYAIHPERGDRYRGARIQRIGHRDATWRPEPHGSVLHAEHPTLVCVLLSFAQSSFLRQ